MRKFLSILLCCAVILTPLCSCGSSGSKGKSAESAAESTVYKRVGADKYGYIDVPESWIDYTDTSFTDASLLQFSDKDGISIITMQYFKDTDAQNCTFTMGSTLEKSIPELSSAVVEINGTKAYQLYGYAPDVEKIFACWILDGSDGLTHCITVEGVKQDVFSLPETYKPEA